MGWRKTEGYGRTQTRSETRSERISARCIVVSARGVGGFAIAFLVRLVVEGIDGVEVGWMDGAWSYDIPRQPLGGASPKLGGFSADRTGVEWLATAIERDSQPNLSINLLYIYIFLCIFVLKRDRRNGEYTIYQGQLPEGECCHPLPFPPVKACCTSSGVRKKLRVQLRVLYASCLSFLPHCPRTIVIHSV